MGGNNSAGASVGPGMTVWRHRVWLVLLGSKSAAQACVAEDVGLHYESRRFAAACSERFGGAL